MPHTLMTRLSALPQCNKCFRNFAVKSTLVAHMKIHQAVKEHTCKHCNKKFTTGTSLRVHCRYSQTFCHLITVIDFEGATASKAETEAFCAVIVKISSHRLTKQKEEEQDKLFTKQFYFAKLS